MSLDGSTRFTATVRVASADTNDADGIDAAIKLGNQARTTLGHLPFARYREAAANGTLLLAYSGEQVVGYALYALARGRVRLSHLCIDPQFRRRGVARLLAERISELHADYLGISVRCRQNYNLGDMWISLGFTQVSERPGRSKAGHVLIAWWRDHQHPNLFTRDPETVLVRAAVDLNVLRDLAEAERPDRDESLALIADDIADRLELGRTAALDAEINAMEGALRGRCTAQAQRLTPIRADPELMRAATNQLLAAARVVDPTYPRDGRDTFDVKHMADAAAAQLNVFITRDQRLGEILGPAAEQHFGLRVLRPAQVVIHIDELVRAEAYRPAALLDTTYEQRLIGSRHDNDLVALVNTAAGERRRDLLKTARALALAGHDRVGIYSPAGKLLVAWAVVRAQHALRVPLLRVAGDPVADTLIRQMLFRLRQQARDERLPVVQITDRILPQPARLAAINDGFRTDGDAYYAFTLDVCAAAADVEHHAVIAARHARLPEPPPLRSGMPAVAAAEIERVWWPAKIIDSALPTYLIPIQQGFSADLLGVPPGLLPRHDSLGLNREHVYYRSPDGPQVHAPARLLWYMSAGGSSVPYPAAVIACSHLDAVVTGTPEDLHSRFRHLGVWNKATIESVARGGLVQALRFTNTEIFSHHVAREHLRALAAKHGFRGVPPQGPARVPASLFAVVYQEGTAR